MRYFAGFLVIVALILFGIVIFGSTPGTNTKKTTKNGQVVKTLPDYANTVAEVRMTVDGPIYGDDLHRQIRISINSRVRTLDAVQGYQGNIIKTESFANNESAYSAFLHALYKAGYTTKLNPKINKFASDSDQGSCALGQRIYFELVNTGTDADQRLWTSNCGKEIPGNFGGATGLIFSLFTSQISNYNDFTADVSLL